MATSLTLGAALTTSSPSAFLVLARLGSRENQQGLRSYATRYSWAVGDRACSSPPRKRGGRHCATGEPHRPRTLPGPRRDIFFLSASRRETARGLQA